MSYWSCILLGSLTGTLAAFLFHEGSPVVRLSFILVPFALAAVAYVAWIIKERRLIRELAVINSESAQLATLFNTGYRPGLFSGSDVRSELLKEGRLPTIPPPRLPPPSELERQKDAIRWDRVRKILEQMCREGRSF